MRISDWSSDVCSSDLMTLGTQPAHIARATLEAIALQIGDVLDAMEADLGLRLADLSIDGGAARSDFLAQLLADLTGRVVVRPAIAEASRSEERRVGKECVSTCRSRWSPSH